MTGPPRRGTGVQARRFDNARAPGGDRGPNRHRPGDPGLEAAHRARAGRAAGAGGLLAFGCGTSYHAALLAGERPAAHVEPAYAVWTQDPGARARGRTGRARTVGGRRRRDRHLRRRRQRRRRPPGARALARRTAPTPDRGRCCGGGDSRMLLGVSLGTGLGGGGVADGRLLRGAFGGAGEIGHVSIDRDGAACHCGQRGCVESYVAGPAIARRYRERTGRALSTRAVCDRAWAGEPEAQDLLECVVDEVAAALASVAAVVDPDRVVVGGGLGSRLADRLPALARAVRRPGSWPTAWRSCPPAWAARPSLRRGRHGPRRPRRGRRCLSGAGAGGTSWRQAPAASGSSGQIRTLVDRRLPMQREREDGVSHGGVLETPMRAGAGCRPRHRCGPRGDRGRVARFDGDGGRCPRHHGRELQRHLAERARKTGQTVAS